MRPRATGLSEFEARSFGRVTSPAHQIRNIKSSELSISAAETPMAAESWHDGVCPTMHQLMERRPFRDRIKSLEMDHTLKRAC